MEQPKWDAADWPTLASELRRQQPADLAWQAAFDRLYPMAKETIAKLPSHEEDPNDLVNEVLIKLALPESQFPEILRALKSPERADRYFASMMRNAVLTRLRRLHRNSHLFARLNEIAFAAETDEVSGFTAEEQEFLNRQIERLSSEEKYLLRMKYWDHLSPTEIASKLGISYANAAVRLFRLLRKLRTMLRNIDPSAD